MSSLKNIRHRIEYAAFLTLAVAARALPVELASRWSGACWRFIAPRLRRHRRALDNIASAFPEKTPAEVQAIAVAMWDNLGRNFAEFFHLDQIVEGDRLQLEDPELFATLRAHRGGVVVCSLHMGNWEIVSQSALRVGWAPAGVYQKITNPYVDRYVNRVRAPYYPGGLLEKSSRTAITLMRYARDGGCVAFLADQREGRGVGAPLFARPAPSTPFPSTVARSLNIPIYLFRIKRLPGVRFTSRVMPVEVPRTGDREADVAAGTCNLQAAIEGMIREAPEQWMWAHRRWD
jgi:Kdo2-lipid IVA lauroyltransferase/acyltransferase